MRRVKPLPRASVLDSLTVYTDVLLPTLMKGPIIRRPGAVSMAERLELDSRAVRRLQSVRAKYGSGPLLLRMPVRNQAILLDPDHVSTVLDRSPEPFSPASSEKRAALAHFEPDVVLISEGWNREDRRRFNEQVLDMDSPVHRMAGSFVPIVQEEAAALRTRMAETGSLSWDEFFECWFRVVRRVVFGDSARDDHELTDMLTRLRKDANWAFLKPKRRGVRDRFLRSVQERLDLAEPGSLAHFMLGAHRTATTQPAHQVPQWLFAFDPAGMATFRALAVLATHPGHADRAREEAVDEKHRADHAYPYLRACILESLRLWPTTPMILRQTTRSTKWRNGVMPSGTGVLIFAPFFHRDGENVSYAHRFDPELWLGADETRHWPLVPFSGGPVICPGMNLVLLLTSAMLAELLPAHDFRMRAPGRLDPARPLPGSLDHYSVRLDVSPRPPVAG